MKKVNRAIEALLVIGMMFMSIVIVWGVCQDLSITKALPLYNLIFSAMVMTGIWVLTFRAAKYRKYSWNALNTLQLLIYRMDGQKVAIEVRSDHSIDTQLLVLELAGVDITVIANQ